MQSSDSRVLRGGAWGDESNFVRAACRDGDDPLDWYWSDGFRVVAGAS